MIDGIGKSGTGRIELQRAGGSQGAAAAISAAGASAGERSGGVGGVVAELVSQGPPVDSAKVLAMQEAIALGRYSVDPDAIADRMIAADLNR